jgi:hypothetical protein
MGIAVDRRYTLFQVALIAWAAALSKVVQAQTDNSSAVVCQGVRDALYTTDKEREQDPCDSCEYDAQSGSLVVECRYDYCEACAKDLNFCGVRVIKIDHTVTEQAYATLLEQQSKLDLGSTKKYCIDYSDGGEFSSKSICIDIDDSFNTNCDSQFEDLPYGLPFLTCDETVGCQCAVSGGKSDTTSPFIGFEKLNFDSCYVEGLTSSTTSSVPARFLPTVAMQLLSATIIFLSMCTLNN